MSVAESRSPALARNMSAPPRTMLNFTALGCEPDATPDRVAVGAGIGFVCRLDARALLPRARRDDGASGSPSPAQMHDRIRVALVYARAEAAGKRRLPPGALARACATPVEAAADELRDLLAAESLGDAGLPRFGLLLPALGEPRAPLLSFVRTLAILARRRGTLFLREADPIVWVAVSGEALDLWTPNPAPGRTA